MTQTVTPEPIVLPELHIVSDQEVIEKLKSSLNYADIAAAAERDALIINLCEQMGIEVSEDEVQASGDEFRKKNALRGVPETLQWLSEQRITSEEWARGMYLSLLSDRLKEQVCGVDADNYYIGNLESCRRVALSQILISDQTMAIKIAQDVRENPASFCALALEHSRGKQSSENGGFAGVRLVAELLPEIAQIISNAPQGEIIGPVQTKLGYHILRIEKWFPAEFNQVREQLLDYLFQRWLNERVDN